MGVISISVRIMWKEKIQSTSGTQGGFNYLGFVSLLGSKWIYSIYYIFYVRNICQSLKNATHIKKFYIIILLFNFSQIDSGLICELNIRLCPYP